MVTPCFYVFADGREKLRINVGSRDERPKEELDFFRLLVGVRKLCPWADPRRLDQKHGITLWLRRVFMSSPTVFQTPFSLSTA